MTGADRADLQLVIQSLGRIEDGQQKLDTRLRAVETFMTSSQAVAAAGGLRWTRQQQVLVTLAGLMLVAVDLWGVLKS